jgi:hypothetical protein
VGRRRNLRKRFWSKVDVQGEDECWLWTAKKNRYGYGEFNLDNVRRSAQAYVIAYERVEFVVMTGVIDGHESNTQARFESISGYKATIL